MITDLGDVQESRLTWPDRKPRAAHRVGSPFKTETSKAEREIFDELKRWNVRDFVVSRNRIRTFAGDPGVAVWWLDPKRKDLRVLACDKFAKLADNLHAVALTFGAMRALERWGAYTAEQAAEGARLALPAPEKPDGPQWWEVLQVERKWPLDAIEQLARVRAKAFHPDTGGTEEAWQRYSDALEAMRREKGATT